MFALVGKGEGQRRAVGFGRGGGRRFLVVALTLSPHSDLTQFPPLENLPPSHLSPVPSPTHPIPFHQPPPSTTSSHPHQHGYLPSNCYPSRTRPCSPSLPHSPTPTHQQPPITPDKNPSNRQADLDRLFSLLTSRWLPSFILASPSAVGSTYLYLAPFPFAQLIVFRCPPALQGLRRQGPDPQGEAH